MPAPKGVDKERYDRCVDKVKRKGKVSNAYAVCAASLKKSRGGNMDKEAIKKAVLEGLPEENITEEMVQEQIKKAVTSEAAPAENGPENDATLNGTSKPSLQEAVSSVDELKEKAAEEVAEASTEASAEAPAAEQKVVQAETPAGISKESQGGQTQEIKFADGMFKPFTLGSTLEQAPTGNVMANMKPSKSDYVKDYEGSTKNEKLTDKDFSSKE